MIVGIDGCKAGWIAVDVIDNQWNFGLFPDVESLFATYREADVFLIDMPIGLIDHGSVGRACDTLARRLLSPYRHASIFTPPCRAALYAAPSEASAINFQYTGKKLSRQSINIIPKIRELDTFLLQQPPSIQTRFVEAHPELIFCGLNNAQALQESKKTKAGITKRLELAAQHFPIVHKIYATILQDTLRKTVLADDIVDAIGLAVAGVLALQFPANWHQIPFPIVYDSKGLPMRLAYYKALKG